MVQDSAIGAPIGNDRLLTIKDVGEITGLCSVAASNLIGSHGKRRGYVTDGAITNLPLYLAGMTEKLINSHQETILKKEQVCA